MLANRSRVYIGGPIASGHNKELSQAIVAHIQIDHDVTNPAIANPNFFDRGLTPPEIFRSAKEALVSADSLIAEVSRPSHGVGYELAIAETFKIPTLCIYQPSRTAKLSAMILGAPGLELAEYEDLPTALEVVDAFLSSLTE